MEIMRKSRKNIGSVNWIGTYTLIMKEVRRFFKVYQQTILAPSFTTLVLLLVISLAFSNSIREVGGILFLDFLAPGLIIMTMIQNSYANTSSSIISSKVAGNIVDILMPPLSSNEIIISYTFGAVLRSFLIGLVTGAMMIPFLKLNINNFGILLFMSFSGSVFLGLLGFITGVWAEKFDNLSAVSNFIVTPLTFLSGTFYSVKILPEPFYSLSLFNPFFYIIDGFRYAMTGYNDSNILIGFIYLTFINIFLYLISWIILEKGWYLKT